MQIAGVILGVYTFVMIGVLHIGVVKIERMVGSQVWPFFIMLGVIFGAVSLVIDDVFVSSFFGVSGVLFAWSGPELKKQKERVSQKNH